MIKINFKQKLAVRKMQKELKRMYGEHLYGYLLAFLLDSTRYFIGTTKTKRINTIEIRFNEGWGSKIDLDKETFSHPEFEE